MASADSADFTDFANIIGQHVVRYPLLQAQDLYKLAHQASLGSGHAVPNADAARQWLANELSELGPGPAEPLLDPIAPDAGVVRVHLRPFLAGGGDAGQLADAFVRTANEFRGSLANLKSCWGRVEIIAGAGVLPFPEAEVRYVGEQVAAMDFPAVHHSDAFRAAYRPAYRVVATAFLPAALRAGMD